MEADSLSQLRIEEDNVEDGIDEEEFEGQTNMQFMYDEIVENVEQELKEPDQSETESLLSMKNEDETEIEVATSSHLHVEKDYKLEEDLFVRNLHHIESKSELNVDEEIVDVVKKDEFVKETSKLDTNFQPQLHANEDDGEGAKQTDQMKLDLKSQELEEEIIQEGKFARKPLNELLTDVGTFSLSSLCASLLAELYGTTSREFCSKFMRNFVLHLGLPEITIGTMEAFLDEDAPDGLDTLVPAILKDRADAGLVLQELVYFAIKDGVYDARSRVLIHSVASFLRVRDDYLEIYEEGALNCLKSETNYVFEEQKAAMAKLARKKKIRRRIIITAAAIGGGALIGLTGGLAVPLLATGAAAIAGGAGAAVIGSIAGTVVIGSLFGVAGAGLTGLKMKKRIGQVEEFAFEDLTEGEQLHITVAVSGWLNDDEPSAFRSPWESLYLSKEQYCLRYESRYLKELGGALDKLATTALTMVAAQALQTTVLAALLAAMAAPAVLIQLSGIIDNPWGVCIKRSIEVGQMLAHALLSRQQGMRPISLIGYSFGARVIFYCLKEMLKQKPAIYEGIIQNVILLGAPVPAAEDEWTGMDKVVCGRIINAYSSGDWILKVVFRASEAKVCIAGLQPILWKHRRLTNVDISDIVTGHLDYRNKIADILKVLGIRCKTSVWKQSSMLRKARQSLPNGCPAPSSSTPTTSIWHTD